VASHHKRPLITGLAWPGLPFLAALYGLPRLTLPAEWRAPRSSGEDQVEGGTQWLYAAAAELLGRTLAIPRKDPASSARPSRGDRSRTR